jgi:hypothetical protein
MKLFISKLNKKELKALGKKAFHMLSDALFETLVESFFGK